MAGRACRRETAGGCPRLDSGKIASGRVCRRRIGGVRAYRRKIARTGGFSGAAGGVPAYGKKNVKKIDFVVAVILFLSDFSKNPEIPPV